MEEVFEFFKDADAQTLAIFDIDMVLVQPSEPAFQMANIQRFRPIAKRIMSEVPADKQMMFLSLITISSDPVLIDARFPQFLQQMQTNSVQAMALTANLTGPFGPIPNMEQWRVHSLRKLGIDFTKTAPHPSRILFSDLAPYRGNHSTYLDGAFCVNGTIVSKGEALLAFLRKTKVAPKKILFIDDREENLQSVEAALQKYDTPIAYQGLHFLGAQKFPSKRISEEAFESRWQKLASQARELS